MKASRAFKRRALVTADDPRKSAHDPTESIIRGIVTGLSVEQRKQLAVFCSRNDHLREVGLAIAAALGVESSDAATDAADAAAAELAAERARNTLH